MGPEHYQYFFWEEMQSPYLNVRVCIFLCYLGQREKDSPADPKTTIHGLFALEIVHGSNDVYPSMYWCFRSLYPSILSGKTNIH